MLNTVAHVNALRVPPGNRLEALHGDRAGSFSIRVNDQYRITFRFEGEHAHDVCCEDYH
jgi:proteic killer suppression protein